MGTSFSWFLLIIVYLGAALCLRHGGITPYETIFNLSSAISHAFSVTFSEEEKKCVDSGTVLFRGSCYPLLINGYPCPENHRLVLDREKAKEGRFVPYCRLRECQKGFEYSKRLQKCVSLGEISRTFCSYYSIARPDLFGEVECICLYSFARNSEASDNHCHPIFTQQICKGNEVLVPVYDIEKSTVGICVEDNCPYSMRQRENFTAAVQFPNKTITCFKLYGQSPCPMGFKFTYNEALPGRFLVSCSPTVPVSSSRLGYVAPVVSVSDECVPDNKNMCIKPLSPISVPPGFKDFN